MIESLVHAAVLVAAAMALLLYGAAVVLSYLAWRRR